MIDQLMPKRKLDPLPSAAFQILLSLADGDLHGYGIMRQVEEQTNGRMRLGPGTLYSSIQVMLEEGLIEEVNGSSDQETGHERRGQPVVATPLMTGLYISSWLGRLPFSLRPLRRSP